MQILLPAGGIIMGFAAAVGANADNGTNKKNDKRLKKRMRRRLWCATKIPDNLAHGLDDDEEDVVAVEYGGDEMCVQVQVQVATRRRTSMKIPSACWCRSTMRANARRRRGQEGILPSHRDKARPRRRR